MIKKVMLLAAVCLISAGLLSACHLNERGKIFSSSPVPSASEVKDKEEKTMEYKKLSPEEAKSRMEANQNIVIVDVRTLEEYNEKHIPEAVNIPVESLTDQEPELLPDKEAEILVYCRSGVRSRKAAEKLLELGYTNVEDIGGIIDWPYDTVKE